MKIKLKNNKIISFIEEHPTLKGEVCAHSIKSRQVGRKTTSFKRRIECRPDLAIRIERLSKKIKISQLLEYINSFYNERIYLIMDHKFTCLEEQKWLENSIKEIRKNERLHYICFNGKKIIASVEAKKDRMREKCNVCLGIAIKKEFRGCGLGTILLKLIIGEAKTKFKPKNIYLSVISKNCPAKKLYEKIGFREFAVFPKWVNYENKYIDKVFMKLEK
ncbi:MAG: GNAT family N-acetyltransferase [Candidatus Micrarchaeia archaeon]